MKPNKAVLDEIYNLNQLLLREIKCDSFRLEWVHKEESLYLARLTNTGVISKAGKPIYTMNKKDGSIDGLCIIQQDTMDNDDIMIYMDGLRIGILLTQTHIEIQSNAVIAAIQRQNKERGIKPN